MSQYQCIKARVSGRVQGVFYRKTTQEQARSLGLTGYAKNLADGTVEVVACGSGDKIKQLVAFLHHGPERADVDSVSVDNTELADYTGFETL